MSVDALRLRK